MQPLGRTTVVGEGFTPSEAEQLRRAAAAWRHPGIFEKFRQKLFNGLPVEFAELAYQKIQGFGL